MSFWQTRFVEVSVNFPIFIIQSKKSREYPEFSTPTRCVMLLRKEVKTNAPMFRDLGGGTTCYLAGRGFKKTRRCPCGVVKKILLQPAVHLQRVRGVHTQLVIHLWGWRGTYCNLLYTYRTLIGWVPTAF